MKKEIYFYKVKDMENKIYEKENDNNEGTKFRKYDGIMRKIVMLLLCAWTVFQLYFSTVGTISAINMRAIHCIFLLVFTFILFPASKKENIKRYKPPISDIIFAILSSVTFVYLICNYTFITQSGGRVSTPDIIIAGIAILLVLESARRVAKNLLPLALVFLAYSYLGEYITGFLGHNGFTLKRILITQFWGTEGILGIGSGVFSTYIFIFVIFGAFLKYGGFSDFINEIALALVGHTTGGPAKVAVIASALMGMMNGSAVANVATTGTITIPMMKKTGYKKEFAAAVEAVASTGGQFCPPVMGAVGFVMAEFLHTSYIQIMIAATVPALLYYISLIFAVHFEAKRMGLSGIKKENIPDTLKIIKRKWYLVLPFISLIGLMVSGYTPVYAALVSILVTIVTSYIGKDTKMTVGKIIQAATEGASNAISVGICCIVIGIIIGSVTLTGLGLNMGYFILSSVNSENIYITGIFVMIMSTILGMGVPGVAAYVIVQTVAVPVLIKSGITPVSAHMFCLIYACLSNITPPVAISSYIASGIANSDQTKTALISVKLGLIGFIIPFFFLASPQLLISDISTHTIIAIFTAIIGTVLFTSSIEGYMLCSMKIYERAILFISAMMLLDSSTTTDIIGIIMFVPIIMKQYFNATNAEKKI